MIKTLSDCTVGHPVENILSWTIASIGIIVTIGLACMVINYIRDEWF
jgi:hypothetical protein